MSKKKKIDAQQTDECGRLERIDTMNVVSDTEYTGMIPTPPGGCDDANSYREIGDIPAESTIIGDLQKEKNRKKNAR